MYEVQIEIQMSKQIMNEWLDWMRKNVKGRWKTIYPELPRTDIFGLKRYTIRSCEDYQWISTTKKQINNCPFDNEIYSLRIEFESEEEAVAFKLAWT